ncbi:MAG: M4 family metallopeptidase [Actinobacteria bacterium]|nr:M4 family metallopeptidase [Actinomycetota bacterium]
MTGDHLPTAYCCSIVPPHILERLAHSADAEIADAARQALRDVAEGMLHRRAHAAPESRPGSKPRLAPGTLEGGPQRLICDAEGGTTLPGTQVRGEGEPDTGDVAVAEAYDGLGDTWQLFADAFERNSLDGRGLPLRATVHYGENYDNAFWDGTQMVFGDGDGKIFGRFTASLDVIGHELAHGVTEHTAGLMYQGQPGALNESMSDVFGSMVKQRRLGQDAADADWLIGAELLIGELAGQALRSMKAPGTAYDSPLLGKDPQPGHMDDYVETDDDHGGVHINSGIPNRAFYLLATALGGASWEAPGRIWYAVLTGPGISADCDFVTFAGLTVDEAIGQYGVQSPEVAAVKSAWAQVGVLGGAESDGEGPVPVVDLPADPGEPVPAPVPDDSGEPSPEWPGVPEEGGVGHHERGPDDMEHEGEVPAGAVVEVTRSGGVAGLTARRSVALDELPAPQQQQWRSVLGNRTLQTLDAQAAASAARQHPDTYCYGVSCPTPPTEVSIREQDLPDDLKALLEETLREA